jgi:hypothetical protein
MRRFALPFRLKQNRNAIYFDALSSREREATSLETP